MLVTHSQISAYNLVYSTRSKLPLACAMREDPRVELTILGDDAHSQEELTGLHVQRCWRFDSISNPARLLRAIVKSKPDAVWFNIGFSTFARTPVAPFWL